MQMDTRDEPSGFSRRQSLLRWLDVVAMGIASAAVLYVPLPSLQTVASEAIEGRPLNPYLLAGIMIVLGVVALHPLFDAGCWVLPEPDRRNGVLSTRYPALCWSVLLGALLLQPASDADAWDVALLAGITAASVFLHVVWRWFVQRMSSREYEPLQARAFGLKILAWFGYRSRKPAENGSATTARADQRLLAPTPAATLDRLTKNPAILFDWLSSDEPIITPDRDLFGVDYLVDRLVNSIEDRPERTIGLLGDFGAGKTSIIEMARKRVLDSRPSRRPIFVRVRAWGITPERLPEAVLQEAVVELSRHVDTVALGGLPQRYVQAMKSVRPSWLDFLHNTNSPSPLSQLHRLDRVVAALGTEMIFIIEDLDRNAPPDDLAKLYVGLQALLDHLRECSRLSFVLAMAHTGFDFDRLCDVRIAVPRLRTDQVGAVVQAFRHRLLLDAMNAGIIIPNRRPTEIDALAKKLPAAELRLWVPAGVRPDHSLPWKHILPLLAVPRRLKATLNQIRHAWRRLQGEVDFDELLLVETVRISAPAVIDAVVDIHADGGDIFSGMTDRDQERAKKRIRRMQEALLQYPQRDRSPLRNLASHFTKGALSNGIPMYVHGRGQPTQSLTHDETYWDRIWSSHVGDPSVPRDQVVLAAIRDWKRHPSPQLASKLEETPEFAEVFERLIGRTATMTPDLAIQPAELLALASSVNRHLVAKMQADACEGASKSFAVLWRQANNTISIPSNMAASWLEREVMEILPHSLRLALDLLCYWGDSQYSPVDKAEAGRIGNRFISRAEAAWKARPAVLAETISAPTFSHMLSLSQFLSRLTGDGAEPSKGKDAHWLIPILRETIEMNPEGVAPNAVALVLGGSHTTSSEEGEPRRVSAELRSHIACALIPDDDERLAFFTLVLQKLRAVDRSAWDDLVQAWVDQAIATLEGWIGRGAKLENAAADNPEN